MTAIVTINTRIFNASQFLSSFTSGSQYLFIGRPQPWTDDNYPDAPNGSDYQTNDVRRDMMAMKRINSSDASLGVLRRNWQTGLYYDIYRHDYGSAGVYGVDISTGAQKSLSSFLDANFYVVTDENKVYKCLWNRDANGNLVSSTVKPTGISTTPFTTSDGYVWKFMYAVSSADALKFISSNFIPVKTLGSNPGSSDPYYTQWQVQQAAVNGPIDRVILVSGGTNYAHNAIIPVTVDGDGTGATATAYTNSSGVVTSIVITAVGSGYTWATFTVPGSSTNNGAIITPVIAPKGGHGSDPVNELGGHYVLIDTVLSYTEGSGDFPQMNDFRRIGIINNPYVYGTQTVATAPTLDATMTLVMNSGVGDFLPDEDVIGSGSGSRAKVVSWDSTSRLLKLIQPTGYKGSFDITGHESITGQTSATAITIASSVNPEVDKWSGTLIYLEHLRPISRQENQQEDIKIAIEA